MNWVFKVNGNVYSKNINVNTLTELNALLANEKTKSGFLELENTLVNINLIEQICEERKYTNGEINL